MSDFSNYPAKYLQLNAQKSKNLSLVMQIEGIDQLFGVADAYTKIRYGDEGITFGLPGVVYGGLRRLNLVKPYIMLDQSLTVTQRIEPEAGKGNVGTITITLIDKNGEISAIVSPGITVDEVIAKREVKIFLGFTQSSFPEDYLLAFRGYITSVQCPPGVVKLQLSDGTMKTRQPVFDTPSTKLDLGVNSSQTNIDVVNTSGFHQKILGPDGIDDPTVRTYLKIDSEWMEYSISGIASDTLFNVLSRGGSHSLGSTPDAHSSGAGVTNAIQLGGNAEGINCIDAALKVLLSGWNGPCEENISILSFVYTYDVDGTPYDSSAFVLKTDDAKKDLGLTPGDYFEITGATGPGNNVSGKISDILILNDKFRIILTDQVFSLENPSTAAVASFRSKYDTLPVTAGVKCRMRDVDVPTFEMIRSNYFSSESNIRLYYDSKQVGKDLISTDIFLPIGCYGVSRNGRISISITKPPLPGTGKYLELNKNNILEPEKIIVTRATNTRSFFNLITYKYNYSPLVGDFLAIKQFLDTDSLSLFNQTSELPIEAKGLTDDLGGGLIAQQRGGSLLTRYKNCALMIDVKVNWSVGSLIEVSDIVLLRDEGDLQIMNFETGKRNIGIQLFEVIDRQYSIVNGSVTLKLMGGVGFDRFARFGLFSPSSLLNSGSTSTKLRLTPSFGQTKISSEMSKWRPLIGMPIQVHSFDWSVQGQSVITGIDSADPTALVLDPPLGFTPLSGYQVDIGDYPTGTDPAENKILKTLYTYLTPTIPVLSGVSDTEFNISLIDAAKLTVGNSVILRNDDYSSASSEIKVLSIVGTLVTVATPLGFTPNSSYFVEGIGFHDGTSFYRYG